MSAALIEYGSTPAPVGLNTIAAIAVYARTVEDTATLSSIAARINAARELAKAQDDVRDIRRMLMHAEVAVLIRRGELNDPTLHSWQKVAIKAFQRAGEAGTHAFVEAHFDEYGKAQQLGRALRDEQADADADAEGERFARDPRRIARWQEHLTSIGDSELDDVTEEMREALREDVASQLRDLVEGYTVAGEPFTVEDVTDAVLERMGDHDCATDPAFRDGVRRVCREAVRASSVITFDGEALPRTIAVEAEIGWVRIPIESATPHNIAATISEREKQIERDKASVDRLARFLGALTAEGCGEFDPIADYLPHVTAA